METRWSSGENPNGQKGAGAKENNGAKGHPADGIEAGASFNLLNIQGIGIINRIWITISDRSPEMLRSLKIEMFWDNEKKPAVSVPFGDFFGMNLGVTSNFDSELFASPEGRSFNCYIPMPFRKGARIMITNESRKKLTHLFFDVDYSLLKSWQDDYLYFHAFWNRDTATAPSVDFQLLPAVSGKGKFLAMNVGVNANPLYRKSWWGEGEVKMYIDGDKNFPTLVGTGTEDYIGTAWGQGRFASRYSGCLLANDSTEQWSFYRYHVPDPVYFSNDIRVTLQQIGGNGKKTVQEMLNAGVPLIPIAMDNLVEGKGLIHLYEKGKINDLKDPSLPDSWTNFYRSDDVSATAYFYLDKPSDELPQLQSVNIRTARMKAQ
jgi:hypothetical protein